MKKILILAAAAIALSACDNNEDSDVLSPVAAKVHATIGDSSVSRAVDQSWSAGDEIGISSTVGGVAVPYVNVKYTTAGDGNFEGTELFFYKPMTLTAYYPYTGSEGSAPGVAGLITATTSAENQERGTQPDIDFLWDSQSGFTAADPNVYFKFAHKMSKVTFTFQSSPPYFDEKTGVKLADGVDVKFMDSYKINELGLVGTFNTATGVCSIKNNIPLEALTMKVENVKDDVPVRSIIIFPQTLSGGSTILDLYTDELNNKDNLQHYTCSLSFSDGTIKPGYHYKYTIKVSKIGLIVGKMTVEPWVEEDRYMTATIDGDKVFEEQ